MDLLDELNLSLAQPRTFKKTLNIDVEQGQEQKQEQEQKGMIDDVTFKVIGETGSTNFSKRLKDSSSLLDRVRRRLNGQTIQQEESRAENYSDSKNAIEHDLDETQRVEENHGSIGLQSEVEALNADTQSISEDFQQTQEINQTITMASDATLQIQTLDRKSDDLDQEGDELTQTLIRKRNLNAIPSNDDDSEEETHTNAFANSAALVPTERSDHDSGTLPIDATAKILSQTPKEVLINCFGSDSESESNLGSSDSDSKNSHEILHKSFEVEQSQAAIRAMKIEKLAAKKRAERLLREENESSALKKDLDLTSEENEVEEDPVIYESETENELIRKQNSKHEVHRKKMFEKADLFAAFKTTSTIELKSPIKQEHTTPPTTPLADSPTNDFNKMEALESSDEEDDFNAADFFDKSKVDQLKEKNEWKIDQAYSSTKKLSNSVLNYRQKLEAQYAKEDGLIDLDSDKDSDSEIKPTISKITRLDVKTKFSKKMQKIKKDYSKKSVSKKQLFDNLKQATRTQLKRQTGDRDREHDTRILQLQQDQVQIEDWLERELENNRRTKDLEEKRKKRKIREKEKSNSDNESDVVPESDTDDGFDVPESEVDESDHSDEEGESEEEQHEVLPSLSQKYNSRNDVDSEDDSDSDADITLRKSRRKNVLKEDDEDEHFQGTTGHTLKNKLAQEQKNGTVDLGSFGGNLSQAPGSGIHSESQQNLKVSSVSVGLLKKFSSKVSPSIDVFDKLKQDTNIIDDHVHANSDGWLDSSASFKYDITSQKHASLHLSDFPPTQSANDRIASQTISAENDVTKALIDEGLPLETEKNSQSSPVRRRLFKRSSELHDPRKDDVEEKDNEEQLEDRERRVQLFRAKEKEREEFRKRERLEMKRKGLHKILENEAEESEDEWQGIGGIDAELSDEANSEDERMLDDVTKQNVDESEIMKMLANEDLQKDERLVHRILDDIHNGGFRKRGARNALDLDVSDDEDELIRRYNTIKNQRLKEKLMEDSKLSELSKNTKSKAFFETITEDTQASSIDDAFQGNDAASASEIEEDLDDDPFTEKQSGTPTDTQGNKRTFKLTEASVQKTLSFINEDQENEIQQNYKLAALQHAFEDDDDNDDLFTLKQKSIISISERTPQKRSHPNAIDLTSDDNSPNQLFKHPSRLQSFQSFNEQASSVSNEVRISTAYKMASSSRASVTYIGNRGTSSGKVTSKFPSTVTPRVLKARKLSTRKTNRLKTLGVSDFD